MPFELVVIGASLGGLHALIVVLEGLPAAFPLPLVVVQHRGAEAESGISEVLQRHTGLMVTEVEDKEMIVGGRVYLAPPDYHLLAEPDRTFALSTEAPVRYARPSIDVLFESAADVYREKVVGVLLTGASVDGARGAHRIKQQGGWLIVQDPATAESRVMPEAGLAATQADEVVAIDRIAESLQHLAAVV
jgi:two-component system chemotaxis response regulator CheB